MNITKISENKRYIAINFILFAMLYLSVTFNKEFIRPVYGHLPIIGIIIGSFPNFMAAYIISLFSLSPILKGYTMIKKARLIFYTISIIVFLILTIEELKPFVNVSKTYDIFDIIASGVGALFAIITFEIIVKIGNKKHI